MPPEGNRTDVPIEEIPLVLQQAVIAAEDREFEENAGFSISGYGRAALGKITGREVDERLGGTIEVSRHVGAVFTVQLPLPARVAEAAR